MFNFFRKRFKRKEELRLLEGTVRMMDLKHIFRAPSVDAYIAESKIFWESSEDMPVVTETRGGDRVFAKVIGGHLARASWIPEIPRKRRDIGLMSLFVDEYFDQASDIDQAMDYLVLLRDMMERNGLDKELFIELVSKGFSKCAERLLIAKDAV